jgi:predicted TIM-barrel fold metal-dependent hydrolase
LIELLGSERVCFGSDFPHAEGLDDPLGWMDQIEDLPADDVTRIMGGNLFGLVPTSVPH